MIKSILVFCYKKKKYFSFGMNNVDLDFNLPLVSQKKKKKDFILPLELFY